MLSEPTYLAARMVAPALAVHFAHHWVAAARLCDEALPPPPPADLTPREAFTAPHETVAVEAAVGRTSAELVAPYPPGVPLLVPGERITAEVIAAVAAARAAGTRIAYAADPTFATVQVVRR